MSETYTGPVCYLDGWHHTVVKDEAGYDVPGERLFLQDDGVYRAAADGDESWHDRKHQRFATVTLEDGAPSLRLTAEQFAKVQDMLRQEKGE